MAKITRAGRDGAGKHGRKMAAAFQGAALTMFAEIWLPAGLAS
ncbi:MULTISPECIES: hypothetical protein [unclassified Mesorhizobium]|nr:MULTISPECIES: hypothetical protein [unclassified Mesorhizobium]